MILSLNSDFKKKVLIRKRRAISRLSQCFCVKRLSAKVLFFCGFFVVSRFRAVDTRGKEDVATKRIRKNARQCGVRMVYLNYEACG